MQWKLLLLRPAPWAPGTTLVFLTITLMSCFLHIFLPHSSPPIFGKQMLNYYFLVKKRDLLVCECKVFPELKLTLFQIKFVSFASKCKYRYFLGTAPGSAEGLQLCRMNNNRHKTGYRWKEKKMPMCVPFNRTSTFIIYFRLLEFGNISLFVNSAFIYFTISFSRRCKKKMEKWSYNESIFYCKSGTGLQTAWVLTL